MILLTVDWEDQYLTGGWNPDCSRPVVIQMSHLIGQPLEMISLHPNAVMDTDVMSRRDCALSDMLRHNEEVKPEKKTQHNPL